MAIYEIEKLKDGLHVQDETPNPQIYALFKMGQELEQQGGGGGGSSTQRITCANFDELLNQWYDMKVGDEVFFEIRNSAEQQYGWFNFKKDPSGGVFATGFYNTYGSVEKAYIINGGNVSSRGINFFTLCFNLTTSELPSRVTIDYRKDFTNIVVVKYN